MGADQVIINDHITVHRTIAESAVSRIERLNAEVIWGGGGEGGAGAGPSAEARSNLTITSPEAPSDMVQGAVITYLIGRKTEHYLDLVDSLASLTRHFLVRRP